MVDERYNINVPQFQVPNLLGSYIAGRQARMQMDDAAVKAQEQQKLISLRDRAASGDNSAIRELLLANPEYAKIFEQQSKFVAGPNGQVMAQSSPSIWDTMNVGQAPQMAPYIGGSQQAPQQYQSSQLEPTNINQPIYTNEQQPSNIDAYNMWRDGMQPQIAQNITGKSNIMAEQAMGELQGQAQNLMTNTGVNAAKVIQGVQGKAAETPIVAQQAFETAKAKGEATSYDKEIRTKFDALDEESNALREVIDIYKDGYQGSAAAPIRKKALDVLGGIADVTGAQGLTPEQAKYVSDYESIQKLNTLISRAKLKDFGGADTEKEFGWSSIESPTASNNPRTGIAKAVIGEKLNQAMRDKLTSRQEWQNNGGDVSSFEKYWNQQMAKKTLMSKLTDFSIEQRLGAPVALPTDSKKAEVIYNAMPEGMQYIHPGTGEIKTKKLKNQGGSMAPEPASSGQGGMMVLKSDPYAESNMLMENSPQVRPIGNPPRNFTPRKPNAYK